jgi:hypothetical protein
MKLAITDANIFIDLIHIEFIDHLFAIGLEIHTAIEVLAELNETQQRKLKEFEEKKALSVHRLEPHELEALKNIPIPKFLSNTDGIVFFLATKLQAIVLSGDGPQRKYCLSKNIEVHSILWLLDSFLEKELTTHQLSVAKLEKLILYNDRLPKPECHDRLVKWKSKNHL